MFDAPGLHVIEVHHDAAGRLVVTVETDELMTGCRACGVVAIGHGRRVHCAHDAPAFGTAVVVRWRKRVWRCPDPGCPVGTFSETHGLIGPRAKLTTRAVTWATDALAHDDTTVAAAVVAGTAGAVAGSIVGVAWRRWSGHRMPALAGAVIEDAVVLGLAAAACRGRAAGRPPR
jgi:transposase